MELVEAGAGVDSTAGSAVLEWKKRTGLCALLLLFAAVWASRMRAPQLALELVQTQDVPVLILASAGILTVAFWRPRWALPARLPSGWTLLAGGLALSLLLWWGTYALMGNFPLSRDEHMVVFDMAVFNSGHLAMPIAPEWRPYAVPLVPNFLLNANHPSGLVSGYLPVNAMLRLAFSKLADPAWFNPLLTVLGGAALLDIARRTFGPQDRACWVVLLVYALSAQMLVNAMTTYAMTAHLALNLVWLAAFLRGGKVGHAVAIIAGFLAVGLHQLVFHPIFVAPFLLWRLREGQWRLVLGYAAAYSAILLWWVYYPMMVAPEVAGPAGQVSSDNFITDKMIPLLLNRDPRMFALTILNLLRFVAWQNLALLPLLIAGVPVAIRERGLARALLLGIVLWIVFLALVLPEQGRGYGYRYLNGYVGSAALLAGYGYRELEGWIGRKADGLVLFLSGVTAIAAIPLLFVANYRLLQPHLAVERLIDRQPTALVVIDDEFTPSLDGRWPDSAFDHARNLPDLSNRPLRFSSHRLNPVLLAGLCRRGPVTLITRADMHRVGFIENVPESSPEFDTLVRASGAANCYRAARRSN